MLTAAAEWELGSAAPRPSMTTVYEDEDPSARGSNHFPQELSLLEEEYKVVRKLRDVGPCPEL